MSQPSLKRFIDAQERDYETALSEIKSGRKRSHWMWYIFPQILGLGSSETSKYYAIGDQQEAVEFLQHPILGARLIAICLALLDLKSNDPHAIFGSPDDMKLKSSMTLFARVPGATQVFDQVLDKYFDGEQDKRTLNILGKRLI